MKKIRRRKPQNEESSPKPGVAARKVLNDCGIDSIQSLTTVKLKDIIQSRGAFYEEINLDRKDGRIVTYENRSVISIDKSITDPGKKRFTSAHELGHFELHKDLTIAADSLYELYNWYQAGSHEKEANAFASELLMPSDLFKSECAGKKFGPELIDHLSNTFIVSPTAAILKFVKAGNHPICVFCSKGNKVKWWQMSDDMWSMAHDFVEGWDRYVSRLATELPPPPDSVAGQLMTARGNQSIERVQEIEKSTWFLTHEDDNPPMYEYCNYIPAYNFALSVVWED